ncbi:TMEM175 family protein [Kribbella sp. CA-245084]|uniref:TMEM175 family protein n=1 Tax=Kribbella sp. CA-245084 TaxID=3239940 RepID=UPI003D9345A1
MADDADSQARAPGYRTARMEAFSDGVFAIAITLLVLEIAVPAGSEDDLWGALVDQWPSYLAYLVSFATIGAVWFAHTVITEHLDHATSILIRLNLLLLLVVSFLPFPTRLLAEYVEKTDAERVAATVYGINLLLVSALLSVLWRFAVHDHLVSADLADEDVETLRKRLTPGVAGYVALIVLGLFWPVVAVVGYLAIAVYILVPFRAIRNRSADA